MNNQNIISAIKESLDFLCAMQPGQLYAKSYNALGEFFFAVNDADSLSNEQKAGIAEFAREYGLGKAKYAPATPQMPAHYVFQGNIADLKPAEAIAKMKMNKEALRQILARSPKSIIKDEDGSDPAYRSTEPTEGWENRMKRVRKEREADRIQFREKQGLPNPLNNAETAVDRHRRLRQEGGNGENSPNESALGMHRRKKIDDHDPTRREPPSAPSMRR